MCAEQLQTGRGASTNYRENRSVPRGGWSRVVSTRRRGNPPSLPSRRARPQPCVLTPTHCGVARSVDVRGAVTTVRGASTKGRENGSFPRGGWSRVVSTRRRGNPPSLPSPRARPLPCVLTITRCGVARCCRCSRSSYKLGGGQHERQRERFVIARWVEQSCLHPTSR